MSIQHSVYAGAIALAVIWLTAAGCATVADRSPGAVMTQAAVPQGPSASVPSRPKPAEGSLWTDSSVPFFADKRARCVGDTVIIDIVENTSSSMDVNTKASRSSGIDAGVGNMLGYMRALEAKNRNLNRDQSASLTNKLLSASIENEFEGKGASDRSGQVTASIGAIVIEVLPNGNMAIYGRREMKVNSEVQFITVSGIARSDDIGQDNRIKSTSLAESRIEYYGKGVLADKQEPGWMTRILDHVWPF